MKDSGYLSDFGSEDFLGLPMRTSFISLITDGSYKTSRQIGFIPNFRNRFSTAYLLIPSWFAISDRVKPFIYTISVYISEILKSVEYIGNILINKCIAEKSYNFPKNRNIYLDKVSEISDN
jgi:hypothetical protein